MFFCPCSYKFKRLIDSKKSDTYAKWWIHFSSVNCMYRSSSFEPVSYTHLSVTVAKDGTVFWSDSLTEGSLEDGLYGILANGNGR